MESSSIWEYCVVLFLRPLFAILFVLSLISLGLYNSNFISIYFFLHRFFNLSNSLQVGYWHGNQCWFMFLWYKRFLVSKRNLFDLSLKLVVSPKFTATLIIPLFHIPLPLRFVTSLFLVFHYIIANSISFCSLMCYCLVVYLVWA